MTTTICRAAKALTMSFAAIALISVSSVAQPQMPKTTTESLRGQSSVTTEQLRGTVIYVEGQHLVVRMSDGNVREFNIPESRRFIIDGQEKMVGELKPGTTLTATITTTATPVVDRTVTVGTGKVWWVAGKTVILTLPNGENRTYKVRDDYRFNIEGNKKATVADLRKGMIVSAEKIVEEPRTEIASNASITGHAPPAPKPVVAQAPSRPSPAPEPVRAAAPEPTPAPAPVQVAQAEPAPTTLPATGSEMPLVGMLGLLFTAGGFALRGIRRS